MIPLGGLSRGRVGAAAAVLLVLPVTLLIAFYAGLIDPQPYYQSVVGQHHAPGTSTTAPPTPPTPQQQPPPPPDFYARILPLGASIVWGWRSSDHSGFRRPLRDALVAAGWRVNMVGSKQGGDMEDNDVEAHPGDKIAQVHAAALRSVRYQPNVVLLHAGTNDCLTPAGAARAGAAAEALLDDLFAEVPGVAVVLATLIPSVQPLVERGRPGINAQFRALAARRRAAGQKLVLADMDPPAGAAADENDRVRPDDIHPDRVHPKDSGHAKMARVLYRAIMEAHAAGLITKPNPTIYEKGEELVLPNQRIPDQV